MTSYFTIIHSDGGSRPNPGPGAYAAILQHGDKAACVRGYAPHTTNNQMELAAVIAALHALKSTRIPVKVMVDSQYVHAGATIWLKSWKKNGWRTTDDRPIKNKDLWIELDAIADKFVITWVKVDGHSSNLMNNRADTLVWDTREAEGDPARYQVTDIPTIDSPWSYTGFQAGQVNPQVAQLRDRFKSILEGAK